MKLGYLSRAINNDEARDGARKDYLILVTLEYIRISRRSDAIDQKLMGNVRINLLVKCGAIRQVIFWIKLPYYTRSSLRARCEPGRQRNVYTLLDKKIQTKSVDIV